MDGFTGFKTATSEELPEAVAVVDPFYAEVLVMPTSGLTDLVAWGDGPSRSASHCRPDHADLSLPGEECDHEQCF